MTRLLLSASAVALAFTASAFAAETSDPLEKPIRVSAAEEWNQPQVPAKIFGDTFTSASLV